MCRRRWPRSGLFCAIPWYQRVPWRVSYQKAPMTAPRKRPTGLPNVEKLMSSNNWRWASELVSTDTGKFEKKKVSKIDDQVFHSHWLLPDQWCLAAPLYIDEWWLMTSHMSGDWFRFTEYKNPSDKCTVFRKKFRHFKFSEQKTARHPCALPIASRR